MGHFVVSAAVDVRVGKNIKQPAGRGEYRRNTYTSKYINRLVVVKKQGCDWGACGRPRRRDLATSLALRDGRGEGGSARGQGPRD